MCIVLCVNIFYLDDQVIATLCPVLYACVLYVYYMLCFHKDVALLLGRITDILAKFECSIKYVGGKNSQGLHNRTQISIKWEYPAQTQLKVLI